MRVTHLFDFAFIRDGWSSMEKRSRFLILALLFLVAGCTPAADVATSPSSGSTQETTRPAVSQTAPATANQLAPPTATVAPKATDQPAPSATAFPATATATSAPTAEPLPPLPAPPEPEAVAPCNGLPRPAVLMRDVLEVAPGSQSYLALLPGEGAWCRVILPNYPVGDPVAAAGSLFYVVEDIEAETMTIWQMHPDGRVEPWEVTTTTIDVPYTPFWLTVSSDGGQVAWSTFAPDTSNGTVVVKLWSAEAGDAEPQLLLQRETAFDDHWGDRVLEPLRFSADKQTLYFSWAPIGLGGMWTGFVGNYDNLLALATDGSAGEGAIVFDCDQLGEFLCLGDFVPEETLVYTVRGEEWRVEVIAWDGALLQSTLLADVDHAGYPAFSPSGMLAFSSALVADEPYPDPGRVYTAPPPYEGAPEMVYEAPGLAILWSWLDETHLVANSFAPDLKTQTGILRLDSTQVDPLQGVYFYPYGYITTLP